ncbi:hypothetical protein [Bacillus toyonensis]|uniref:hypothetical protein n=1 Tax=Bacillus toyonensis TaxID=155322 RepID=UPI000BF29612|nr:hypothetical protein [Bacillus toyonensis]PGE91764.1 hypothetical protein COM75_09090 [Bacillus toyonensis]
MNKNSSLITHLDKLSRTLSKLERFFDKDYYHLQDLVRQLNLIINTELGDNDLVRRIGDLYEELERLQWEIDCFEENIRRNDADKLLLERELEHQQEQNNQLTENLMESNKINESMKKELENLRKSLKNCQEEKGIPGNSGRKGTPTSGNKTGPQREEAAIFEMLTPAVSRGRHWGSRERKTALVQLEQFVSGSKKVVIIDPYFYRGGNSESEDEQYIQDLIKIVPPQNIDQLHIISNKDHQSVAIKRQVEEKYGLKLTNSFTFRFHDRVWIADGLKAILVGTSLNGIGRKLSFLLPLPYYDLENLMQELKRFSLLFDKDKHTSINLKHISLDEFINYASNDKILSQYLLGS